MEGITVQKIADRMNLLNYTPCVDLSRRYIQLADINRPALQLTGFFEHFDQDRVQLWHPDPRSHPA